MPTSMPKFDNKTTAIKTVTAFSRRVNARYFHPPSAWSSRTDCIICLLSRERVSEWYPCYDCRAHDDHFLPSLRTPNTASAHKTRTLCNNDVYPSIDDSISLPFPLCPMLTRISNPVRSALPYTGDPQDLSYRGRCIRGRNHRVRPRTL